MIKFSTKARYAMRTTIELAKRGNENPVPLKTIATCQKVSQKYCERLFTLLRKAGIVNSVLGAHGGYVLAREPEKITVREIIEAVEGKIAVVYCVTKPEECSRSVDCVTRRLWSRLTEKVAGVLEETVLSDLLAEVSLFDEKALRRRP